MQQTQTAEPTVKKQKKQQFFRIHIKPNARPYEAFKAKVVDNEIVSEEEKVLLTPPEINIHNFYTHKVVKIKDEKGNYTGRMKFVESFEDAEEGETVENVEIRYIANCPSLDKQWQIKNGYKIVQTADRSEAQNYHGWNFPAGSIQEFDLGKADPLFIEFLKHHQGNGKNPNRDPRNGILFIEVDASKNIVSKKGKHEEQKRKIQFIDNIHESDEVVNIYSEMFGVSKVYDIETKRDKVLEIAEKLTTEGLMKEVEKWKGNYRSTLSGFLSDNKISVKSKKVYIGKNPEPFFKDEAIKSESGTDTITEIVESMFVSQSMFNEVKRLISSI